uniref:Large ribosomal subunit protein mL50 n=1 Tax=Panagrolaimus sp. PS1159 TaxID=55785 RepID=A0AC35F5H5_9BILA
MFTRLSQNVPRSSSSFQCLSYRLKSDASSLTGEQKERLRSKLPSIRTDTDVQPTKTSKTFAVVSDATKEMDEIRARGAVKSNAKITGDWKEYSIEDVKIKFKIIDSLASELGFYIPNSDLHKMKTASDILEFYSTPISNTTKYTQMARDDSLPENLAIREHPVRFHPNDTEALHGGITAYPGEGGEVITLRNKRLYRSFKPKKEWYDYDDQAFDFRRPDGGMPWDPEISQKMDRYVDKKFKKRSL